jgi:hypothetical protein
VLQKEPGQGWLWQQKIFRASRMPEKSSAVRANPVLRTVLGEHYVWSVQQLDVSLQG